MGIFLIFFLFGTWSLAFPLGKYSLLYSHPVFVTGVRMLVAGLILVGFLVYKKQFPRLSKRQFLSLAVLAFLSVYITNILEFWGLTHLSAAKTCFLYSLTPFLSALLSYIHFKEKMTPWKWVGMLVGMIGFIPPILEKTGSEGLFTTFYLFTLPELAVFGAVLCSTYGWILLRVLVKNDKISPPLANGVSMCLGGALALFTSFFTDPWTPIPVDPQGAVPFVGSLIAIIFISNIVCYNLYGYLLKKYTATFLSFFGLLSPFFASLHSWILLGERPSPTILFSSLIILFGLFLIHREEWRLGYISSNKQTKPALLEKNT